MISAEPTPDLDRLFPPGPPELDWRGQIIPGLPAHLRNVPLAPTSDMDRDWDQKRRDYAEWSLAVKLWRHEYVDLVNQNPALQNLEVAKCAKFGSKYFLIVWGWLYEPRNNDNRGGYKPWVPFERQLDLLDAFDFCMAEKNELADLLVSKCRDVGASWTAVGWVLHGWLFRDPFNVLMLSRKEELVDSRHPRSLFWKLDRLYERLPRWMRPDGFNRSLHRMVLFMENPENGNVIGGESTNQSAGRGDRITVAIIDEAAFVPDFMNIWTSLADSTDHRFAISTESLEVNTEFFEMRVSDEIEYRPHILEIDWFHNPVHDMAWYEKQKRRYSADPAGFDREILRNPRTGSGWVYAAAVDLHVDPTVEYRMGNPLYGSMDPGIADNTAIIWLQESLRDGFVDVLDAFTDKGKPALFYASVINGVAESGEWEYGEDAEDLMGWTAILPRAVWYGDTYGASQMGGTMDSFYSELKKKKIYVNIDRLPNGKVPANKRRVRYLKGRREALRALIPRLRFADTPGSRMVLKALQNNRWPPDDGTGRISDSTAPLRDWTTHFVQALEFFAANIAVRKDIELNAKVAVERQQRKMETLDREELRGMPDIGGRRSRSAEIAPWRT